MYNTGFLVINTHSIYCQILDPQKFPHEYMKLIIYRLTAFPDVYICFIDYIQIKAFSYCRLPQLNCRSLYGTSASACCMYIERYRIVFGVSFDIYCSVFFYNNIHEIHLVSNCSVLTKKPVKYSILRVLKLY